MRLRKLKKGLAMILTAAMVVGLMPGVGTLQVSAAESDENNVNTVSSNEAMTPEPTPEQTDGQATEKLITAWQWIDEEEILDEETGNLALPGASEQTPAYFEDVTAFLPTQIRATVVNADDSENPETGVEKTISLGDWECDNYPEEGAYSGSYTFTATLPEGYVLSEETKELTIAVELGGATLYETATATWTYPTKTPMLTWAGSGTAEDPYIITTAQELANMSYIVNAGKKNSAGKNYYELCYKLGADIDIGGKQWVPIGGIKNGTSYLYDFRGSFDGDNHKISNLTFSAVNTNYETLGRSGLFYEINGNAEIKNVKLENVNISMKGVSGALVATIYGGYTTFSNCHVLSGTITSTSTVMQYFGGLIGASTCNTNQSSVTITNCTNRATVTGSSKINDSVGGIIGYTRCGEINISNCYNYGTLSSKFYVGGIVGYTDQNKANTTISNCGNEGSINSQNYVGGIVGIASYPDATDLGHRFTISGCYNKGAITSTNSSRAGGIVGHAGGKGYLYLIIERCYNAGTVTSDIYGSCTSDTQSQNYSTQSVSVKNCVYTGDKVAYFGTGDNDAFNRKVTAEELESGKAAVFLNQGLSEDNLIWYQNLSAQDKDNYPVTDNTHSKVYASDYCMIAATFSNTAPATMNNSHNLEHVAQVDAKCGISGLKEHYKCNKCGELYLDANGTNIVTSVKLVIPPTATEHNHVDGICTVCGDLLTPQQGEDGYYLIYTLGELISYADMVTPDDGAAWIPMNEPTEASQKVRLMADIDMSSVYNAETGKSWNPIGGGDGGAYFKGDFDGNGHTISGLYINSTTVQYAGLFGRLMYGVCCVHDLTLKDVSIHAPNATAAGAVAGFVDSYKKSPIIKNCMVESGTIIGKDNVGGIAGKTSSGQLLSATEEGDPILIDSGYISVIQNCGNKATVTATTNAGGLSGSGPVWIESSYNSGTVTGATSGQITGSLSEKSKVNNCYYLGTSDTAFGVNSTDAGYITNVAYKSADEFASGEMAYLLQGEQEGAVWGQTLGENGDTYPVLKKTGDEGNTVYQYTNCAENISYTNDSALSGITQSHDFSAKDGICKICRYECDHADGYENGACKTCGKAQSVTFDTHSITLADEIGVNFMMILPENAKTENAYMEFSISGKNGKTTNVPFSEAVALEDGRYKFTCLVNSIQMADTITATYHFGENETVTEEYSVKKYIEDIVASDTMDDTTKKLVKSLADYGYYAQLCLSEANRWTIGTDHEQMIHYTDAMDTAVDLSAYAYSQIGEVSGITRVNKSLVLDSKTAIRLLFTVDDTYGKEPVITVKDASDNTVETQLTKQSDGRYCLLIPGISAHKLGETYTIVVDGTMTIQMSALTYAHGVLQSDTMTDATKQAVAALNAYYNAAIEYKNKQ